MDSSLDCISMANNSLSLYVSTGTGSVLSLVYPFGEKTEFQEFTIHSEAITRVRIFSFQNDKICPICSLVDVFNIN